MIKFIVFDFDGVFTNGVFYFDNKDNVKKTYNAKEDLDGKKIWMLLNIELWLQEKKF